MNRINPFESYFDPNKINQAGQVNSPEKTGSQNVPKEPIGTESIGGVQKSNENDFVDTSSMIDDSGDFNLDNFKDEDKSGEIQNMDKSGESTNQDGASQNNEKDLEKASEIINDFLNQKKN